MPRRRLARRPRFRPAGGGSGCGIAPDSGLSRLIDNGHVSSIKNVFDEGPEEARTLSMFAAGGAGRGPRVVLATARRTEGGQRDDSGAARRARGTHERRRVCLRAARQAFARRRRPKAGADPLASRQWSHGAIRLGQARAAAGFKNATNITIAVVDSGIDKTHPDLAATITEYKNFLGGSDKDFVGHGTHVAGIIAAIAGNDLGISGVCGGKILALKVLPPTARSSTRPPTIGRCAMSLAGRRC